MCASRLNSLIIFLSGSDRADRRFPAYRQTGVPLILIYYETRLGIGAGCHTAAYYIVYSYYILTYIAKPCLLFATGSPENDIFGKSSLGR
jgi:hypothetical protein